MGLGDGHGESEGGSMIVIMSGSCLSCIFIGGLIVGIILMVTFTAQ